jgi:hypothetical protein
LYVNCALAVANGSTAATAAKTRNLRVMNASQAMRENALTAGPERLH